MLCGGDHRPKHYLKQSLTFLHDGKGTLQFLWHELRNHTASLSKFIAMLKPRLYFFSFPLLIFCYYFLEGALFVRSFAQLPVPFDPHPLKAWDVPAVSSSVWLPFFPLLPTGWLMPIPPCSPDRQLSWAEWPWAGFGQGGQQVCHTQPALTHSSGFVSPPVLVFVCSAAVLPSFLQSTVTHDCGASPQSSPAAATETLGGNKQ